MTTASARPGLRHCWNRRFSSDWFGYDCEMLLLATANVIYCERDSEMARDSDEDFGSSPGVATPGGAAPSSCSRPPQGLQPLGLHRCSATTRLQTSRRG